MQCYIILQTSKPLKFASLCCKKILLLQIAKLTTIDIMIHFQNPAFLFGLLAIIVPILIHLFNFRRYRTVYFSNVKLLRDIQQKTKRESRLQHLIVLMLRILGISALVFAFAQPYIPRNEDNNRNGNLVAIYVDNSFSMEVASREGNLFQDALNAAKNVVDAFSFSDDYILITNDFLGKYSRIMNRDEILSAINEIEISPRSKSLNEIIQLEEHLEASSRKEQVLSYYLSDFQKSRFSFEQISINKNHRLFLMPLPAEDVNNVSIDSCWFLSPVFKEGQQAVLNVRVHNYGAQDVIKLPLKLYVNNEQKAVAAIDVKAESYTDYQLSYTLSSSGIQCGTLQIEDAPIVFDDQFYFTYEVLPATRIIAIQEKENSYLRALYGKDSLFIYEEMNVNRINYAQFKNAELIVLDQIKEISSGLADELKKFVVAGGNLLVFPSLEQEKDSWQAFLENKLSCNSYGELINGEVKVGRINTESAYFKGAIERQEYQLEMPSLLRFYGISSPLVPTSETIMELENKMPMLVVSQVEKGQLFLSAVALNDEFGNAHKNALFFVPLHNIGIKSQRQTQLYGIIGKDEFQTIHKKSESAEDVFVMKLRDDGTEFIPEQRRIGNETMIYFHSQIDKAGFYDVEQGGVVLATFAFNFDRAESDLHYYSRNELEDISNNDETQMQVLTVDGKDLSRRIASELNGINLWRWFVGFALLAFLGEILVLRFWGRARYAKN